MSIVSYELPESIAKEFTVDEHGKGYVSRRGIARLSGVYINSIRALLKKIADSEQQKLPKIIQPFAGQGFEGESKIPSGLAKAIIGYYYSKGLYTEEGCQFAGLPFTKKVKKTKKSNPEQKVQNRLAKVLNGIPEVKCKTGVIDILTDTEIIEVKQAKHWKHAIGQVIVYNLEYPNHSPRIHLYDECSNDFKLMVIAYAGKLNVKVSFDI